MEDTFVTQIGVKAEIDCHLRNYTSRPEPKLRLEVHTRRVRCKRTGTGVLLRNITNINITVLCDHSER